MTLQRRDNGGTAFGSWLRNQPEIDSHLGFRATDIDYAWMDRETHQWMILEEKTYNKRMTGSQQTIFNAIEPALFKADAKFRGVHEYCFSETSPDDGITLIDGIKHVKDEVIKHLRFEAPAQQYLRETFVSGDEWNEDDRINEEV